MPKWLDGRCPDLALVRLVRRSAFYRYGIVVAVLNLIHVPFGTAVGIYGLWVLFNKETEQLLSGPPAVI